MARNKKKAPSQRATRAAAELRAAKFKIIYVRPGVKADSIYLNKDQDINAALAVLGKDFSTAKTSGKSTILIPVSEIKKVAKKVVISVTKRKRQRRNNIAVDINVLATLGINPKHTKKSTQFAVAVMRLLPSVAAQKHVMRLVLNGNSLPKVTQKADLSGVSANDLMAEVNKRMRKRK